MLEILIDIFEGLFSLTDTQLINFFFKAFSIVFALLYLIFAVILVRQTRILRDTLMTRNNTTYTAVSNVQLVVAIVLFLFALFLI